MSTKVSILEQVEQLQNENSQLKKLKKSFDKMVMDEFGKDSNSIHKALKNSDNAVSGFEKNIISYFGLKTKQDVMDFMTIFCTKSSLEFFKKNRGKLHEEQA